MTSSAINASRILGTAGISEKKMFNGTYIASVVNNNDSLNEGRVTLRIPQVLGLAVSNWARPLGYSTNYSVPSPGTVVHATFTGGDINYPVYSYTVNVQPPISTLTSEVDALMSEVAALTTAVTNMTPGAWTSIILQNGWTNYSGYINAQYRLLNNGTEVEVIGNITAPLGGISVSQVAQLPLSCYPVNQHWFPFTVVDGLDSVPIVGTTDLGFVEYDTISQGILPSSAGYNIPINNKTLSGPPYVLGPSGTQFFNFDQNSDIVDSTTGGQQYLVNTAILPQNSYVNVDYNSALFIYTTTGELLLSNYYAGYEDHISFHETIPLTI